MTALIFGINGQDGFYLNSILIANGIRVIGVSRNNNSYIIGDVSHYPFVEQLIKEHQPDYIFHLAANSSIKHTLLIENYQTIATGTLNILEIVHQHSKHSKVFISGSGLQFVNNGTPITETDPFEARDAYSMARIQSVYAARYFRSLGIKAYVGYFFHHDSPRRSDRHLSMGIIKTILKIKAGEADVLKIGNPQIIKEFNHAYDVMAAIWCLVKQDVIFEATIGCGTAYTIDNWIDICFTTIGINKQVLIDPHYTPDFSLMISNPKTIKLLGWEPVYDINYLAKDMIENG